ncbi:MAG: electron transfer flavoprotein subunit beta/FixA family protein [Bacillota bacterium]|nr:electron transfer flavoprotein subunit beta/FixA family protein [Bacillota bacterium]
MKILVCIKQVPGTNKVEIDEKTGVLKRDGVKSKINPYDLYAIEAALQVREQTGGSVTALTMGPPQAEQIITEAYMMGVDDGCLVTDRRFGGADVLATSYTLSQAVKALGGFDLIICGKQTTDGDTAQVGPALAELLGMVHVAWVKSIDNVDKDGIMVSQDLPDSTETVRLQYPCLITVEKDIMQPRLPSYKRKLASAGKLVQKLTLNDFSDKDPEHYGLNGSATKVERIFSPQSNVEQLMLEGDGNEQAESLLQLLQTRKLI